MYGQNWYGIGPYDRPTIVASGALSPSGTLAATETTDTAAFAGTFSVQGILSVTEGPDILAFSGTGVVSGTLSTTEAADTLAFSGTAGVAGILSVTEGADIAAFAGTFVGAAITGTLSVTEGKDTAFFTDASGGGGRQWAWKKGLEKPLLKPYKEVRPVRDDVKHSAAILSSAGGHARAKSLTANQRTKIATIAAKARWR